MRAPNKTIPKLSESDIRRLWSRVDKAPGHGPSGDCWEWTGGKLKEGYGSANFGGKPLLVHRVSYAVNIGPIPAGLCVLHTCDNPACVNPDHLWLGTQADNVRDRDAKGRTGRACGALSGKYTMPESILRGDDHPNRKHPERMARGERSGKAVLTDAKVRAIRKRYAAGGCFMKTIAAEHGVSASTISLVLMGRIWKHVQGENHDC